ncbi:hypothetical protein K0038_02532 [Pseudomonas syringae]|uniref:hypothetical protein n=1 Tax=Pseudomonas syringae TaxID=317 RepID=UPI001CA89ADF|nr:hypothetical protein [Pseudomonas syringae]MCI3945490.1 hypothetical protein [Pseudomonas syringae]
MNKPNDVRVARELLENIRQRLIDLNQIEDFGPELFELLNRNAQPADQQGEPIQLSEDVREYLQEGIENATGCEDSDVDYDFANELAVLLGPIYRHAQHATAKVRLRSEARQCHECDHIGINDESSGSACHSCDWSGGHQAEDKCPGCGDENCMAAACPKCGGRYVLIAEASLNTPQ